MPEGSISDPYEDDILLWAERQSDLLRRRAAGELVNDGELDWPNIADEIEGVGRGQLYRVESLLTQALLHMLKAKSWPSARDVPKWQADARLFRALSSHTRTGGAGNGSRRRRSVLPTT